MVFPYTVLIRTDFFPKILIFLVIYILILCQIIVAPSSSVSRALDSRSRGLVFETCIVHLVVGVGSHLTSPIRRDARSLDDQDLGN